MTDFNKNLTYHELINLNCQLTKAKADDSIDYSQVLTQLNDTVEKFNVPVKKKSETNDVKPQQSCNLFRLLSRNYVLVFQKLPTKVYDVANNLLNHISVESTMVDLASIILTDLCETFPNSLGSLMTFAVNQVYKVMKKGYFDDNIVYLLNSLTKYCTRADIDDKLQAKLIKIINKGIISPMSYNPSSDSDTSIALKKNYILVLRNLSILSVNANYEHLLASSASASSGGAKMKPESIMSHQHQFQTTFLTSIEKQVLYGLSNHCKDIRIATVELLAHLFLNFIPTGKFNPLEYFLGLYRLPSLNNWDSTLTHIQDGTNSIKPQESSYNESEDMVYNNVDESLLNTGIIESIIFYIQLESFQNTDYLSANLATILHLILTKFSNLGFSNHIANNSWILVSKQWSKVLEFLIKEAGPNCHEILLGFLIHNFDAEPTEGTVSKSPNKFFKLSGTSNEKPSLVYVDIFHNPYQCQLLLVMIENLLPFGIDFNSFVSKAYESDTHSSKIDEKDEAEDIQKIESPSQSILVQLLLKLLINDNDYIRGYSLVTLLKYSKINEVEINQLVLTLFDLFNQELNQLSENKSSDTVNTSINSTGMVSVKLLSYALSLSAIIKQTESIYLQNSTVVKILSFCTQSLKHNSSTSRASNLKSLSCWIILTSLITFYNESEFVRLNSSQILIFWKNLLTSQFVSTGLSANEASQEREVYDNLLLRNTSLVCLLNYINTVELSPESSKQLQFLLIKSYNYLTYLETNMSIVGDITNFNVSKFNNDPYNIAGVGNLLYSNYGFNNKLNFKDYMVSSILYGKKILIKNFTKLVGHLKSDVSSTTIVLVIKIFSDYKLFTKDPKDKPKATKSNKRTYNKVNDLEPTSILLNHDSTYSFGVTSKFNDFSTVINELIINKESDSSPNNELFYVDPFYKDSRFKGYIENNLNQEIGGPWFDCFEEMIYSNSSNSIVFDPSIVIQNDYSYMEKYSTNLITSLVDESIELFQVVFPYLTLKIQSSLLEQIRASLISKAISSFRYNAICVNISIALHGTLNICHTKKISLDNELVLGFIDILKKIDHNSKHLIEINSDSIGLAASFLDRKNVIEQLDSYVSSLIKDIDPIKRGKSLLSMARLYYYTGVGFNEIYNVSYQLLNDPNPIVYYYSLSATNLLFNDTNSTVNTSLVPQLIDRIFSTYLTDSFNYDIKENTLKNLKFKFSSIGLVTHILKNVITSLGPNLRSIPEQNRQQLKSLIISSRYMIGAYQIDDQIEIFHHLLRLLQELIIFDPTLLDDEISFYSDCLLSVIGKNLKLGLFSISNTSLNLDAIFPFNSSFGLYKLGFECFSELLKVYGTDILIKEIIELIWVSLNIKPCEESKKLVLLWMESNLEINWFATLNSLFKMSNKKLLIPYLEVNYQQKLLPLLQRQKKKTNNAIDFKDEEIENIVGIDNEENEKNEPISWEFKFFIYDLLNHLLSLSYKNTKLFERLKPRISDLVKISFLGSTSPINIIKLRGINLLDKVLGLFGDLEDAIYPGVSILEQQQAQIISAIVPCFNAETNSTVIVDAVNVSSKFINLPRIKFYSKQRILKTLIFLLEELSSNKFIKFGFLENMSEFSKKSIQISILNCWALVRLNSEGENSEPELLETLNKYSTLLISLWIVALKEFSVSKYNETNNEGKKELELYNNYWVNFISVLSLELEQNSQFVDKYLDNNASTFFFILFSQCVESLIRNKNIPEVLISLNKLFKNYELVTILFHDEIFEEIIDLLDRLILIDEDTEIQCQLIELVSSLFQTYIKDTNNLEKGFDKLFELVRLSMLPLFNILPFLKADFDANDKQTQILLKHIDSGPHLLILKTIFTNLIEVIVKFPNMVKVDLYSCLLYVFGKIYEFDNHYLVSIILPYLKQVLNECKALECDELVATFYKVIRTFNNDFTNNNTVLTIIILITSGNIELNQQESVQLKDSIIEMVKDETSKSMGLQCIKSLIQHSSKHNLLVVKLLISDIIKSLVNEDIIPLELSLQIVSIFVLAETDHNKLSQLYSLIIPIILKHDSSDNHKILHQQLMGLIHHDSNCFKTIVNQVLSEEQRDLTERLVKGEQEYDNDDSRIELKTFT